MATFDQTEEGQMSFMDKITSPRQGARADTAAFDSQFDEVVTAYPDTAAPAAPQRGTPSQQRQGRE